MTLPTGPHEHGGPYRRDGRARRRARRARLARINDPAWRRRGSVAAESFRRGGAQHGARPRVCGEAGSRWRFMASRPSDWASGELPLLGSKSNKNPFERAQARMHARTQAGTHARAHRRMCLSS